MDAPKERLAAIQSDHPTAVPFHRECSWLGLTEALDAEYQADIVLIRQWIAVNAPCGQRDEGLREPVASYHAGAASERESREGLAQSAASLRQIRCSAGNVSRPGDHDFG